MRDVVSKPKGKQNMTEGHYAVIKYIPDPARSEALNVGIVVWTNHMVRLSIDEHAVARVVRENPQLERDALFYLEPLLIEQFSTPSSTAVQVHKLLAEQTGFPVLFSEPRLTAVGDGGIDATLERLLNRIVRPRRRGGGAGGNPIETLAKQVRPLLQERHVQRNYSVLGSLSGIPRTVDFFANSGANVAVDVVRLAVSQADEIRKRADAEAFKVWDVLGGKQVSTFMTLCTFSSVGDLAEPNAHARRAIESAGARVVTVVEEAASALGAESLL